jgi:hypothetical protein
MYELTEKEKFECLQEARRELGLIDPVPDGWVEITHPTSWNHVALVTEEAYREVWKRRGWIEKPRID